MELNQELFPCLIRAKETIEKVIKNEDNNFKFILSKILEDDMYNSKSLDKKIGLIKLKDIDYFKLYLANTFGKNKLTRKGKLDWVDKNMSLIINYFDNDLELFKSNYH